MAKRRPTLKLEESSEPKNLRPVSRVVHLRSGGSVQLLVKVDLFDLSDEDAKFMNEAIALFKAYGDSAESLPIGR